ncbi:acyl-CoA dehydrogenase family protein [Streptomyces sp. NBC_01717]|uniref:acyl-CoA dehydrogenase family protein n=1 Tax=Streptomyces sp. NBC_01717 TaxID=2975918 RepID=UPI002E3374BD|nr:acyl-CoA dehydrogenase family protein [Streptomyces sp. NBC_01717]
MKATHGTAVDPGRTVPHGALSSGNGKPSGVEPRVLGGPEHSDYYLLDNLLTDEQRALREQVREFMDREVILIINPYWERAEFPFEWCPSWRGWTSRVSRFPDTAARR